MKPHICVLSLWPFGAEDVGGPEDETASLYLSCGLNHTVTTGKKNVLD